MALDPFDYWIKRKSIFPLLSYVAFEILTTPASSASVERVFSYGGEVTKGKRNIQFRKRNFASKEQKVHLTSAY